MDLSRPGKPKYNAMLKSLNGAFRDECLNVNWFLSVEDASKKIEMWRVEYNKFRPYSSLVDLTPKQCLDNFESEKGKKTTFLADTVLGGGPEFYTLLGCEMIWQREY